MIFSKKFTFIKLASLSLVSVLFVSLTQTRASADVNINVLNSVIKSCQDSPPKSNSLFQLSQFLKTEDCVRSRYYYSLFLSKFNALKDLGDLRPGFPASVLIAAMAGYYGAWTSEKFLDCMVSKESNSDECMPSNEYWSMGSLSAALNRNAIDATSICSLCFDVYNTGSTWRQNIFNDLITWFYSLDKSNRKLVVDIFSDNQFINSLKSESQEASQLYLKSKAKVEQEEQERKRRELLQ
ncbi:MAG: hypothetical protein VKL42_22820 [Snowella sp.]|nr:hypothetical protein [Snowella sp.]